MNSINHTNTISLIGSTGASSMESEADTQKNSSPCTDESTKWHNQDKWHAVVRRVFGNYLEQPGYVDLSDRPYSYPQMSRLASHHSFFKGITKDGLFAGFTPNTRMKQLYVFHQLGNRNWHLLRTMPNANGKKQDYSWSSRLCDVSAEYEKELVKLASTRKRSQSA